MLITKVLLTLKALKGQHPNSTKIFKNKNTKSCTEKTKKHINKSLIKPQHWHTKSVEET